MRWLVLLVIALGTPAHASEARGSSETLVGWTEDGTTYAVIAFDTSGKNGPEFYLEVRQGEKVLLHYSEPAESSTGLDRIDVASWDKTKDFQLKKIEPAARKKFAAELVATSTTKSIDRYNCKDGRWTVKKKGPNPGNVLAGGKAVRGHCFSILGGYVNKAGTHALVKLREAWKLPTQEKITEERDRFVLVEL